MRIKLGITTAVVTLLAALSVALGAGAGVAGAATGSAGTPSWGTEQTYSSITVTGSSSTGSVALPSALACSSYGNCVAAGVEASTNQESPLIAVENGAGQWGQPFSAPVPANDDTSGTAVFTSVACSSATTCVAVGAYPTSSNGTQPFVVPFTTSGSNLTFGTPEQVSLPSNALATSAQESFLDGVSCGASGCTAVGTYETNTHVYTAITATPGSGGAWTATAVAAPAGAANDSVLNAISCPSSGACEAVGNYADSSNDVQLWAVQVTNGAAGTAQAVTIPGATASTDTAPSPSAFLDLRSGLADISCPSAGVCTAVGTVDTSNGPQAVLLPISAGTPGQSSTLSVNGSAAYSELESISCSDATHCTTVGVELSGGSTGEAMAATESGDSWSAPVALQSSGTQAAAAESVSIADSVACTSPGICATTGLSYSETGTSPNTSVTEASFFAYSAFVPIITTSSLPAATVGQPYSATLQSGGGTGPANWAVTLGSLPAGLTLNAATGVISGTPTANGQNGFIVTTTNAGPPSLSSTVSLSITVGAAATVKLAYSKVSGHAALVVFSCSGAPCAGTFRLSGVEHLHGKTPTAVDAKAKKKKKRRPSARSHWRAGATRSPRTGPR